MAVRIDRSTRPARATCIPWHLDRAALRRRSEQTPAVISIGDRNGLLMDLRRQVDEMIVGRTLDIEWRRL
jgi:hypothetical protein